MEEVGDTIRPFLDMDNSTSCENSSSENSTGEENDSEINYKNQSQKQVCTYFSDKKNIILVFQYMVLDYLELFVIFFR